MQEIEGVQEFKKLNWANRDSRRFWALGERKPNRSGSSEPVRINYIKACSGFLVIFQFSFSFFPLSRERGSALSLEFRSSSPAGWPVPARWPTSHRGCAAAPDAKQSPFLFIFIFSFSSIPSSLYVS